MIRTVPVVQWEDSLYKILTDCIQGYPIFDSSEPREPDKDVAMQYVSIGEFECTSAEAKVDVASWFIRSTVNVLSFGNDRNTVNEMLNDAVKVVTYANEKELYTMNDYFCHEVSIGRVSCVAKKFNDTEIWQYGVVEIVADVQQKYI